MFKQFLPDRKKFTSKPIIQPSFFRWRSVYDFELSILYSNLKNIVNIRYDNDVDWEDDENFNIFCKFIYKCSSKHIAKFHSFREY